MNFQAHRPPEYTVGDSRLPQIIEDLNRLLIKSQADLAHDTLRLPKGEFKKLAHVLVEFAEDIYNDIGLWQGLERYNRDLFGDPLPLTLSGPDRETQTPSNEDRLCHLLWVLYAEIEPDLILAPTHQDLRRLAAVAADFLAGRFAGRPKRSGVKTFLAQPNKYGWDVKRKLVWLGQHAYLFRYSFQNYVAAHGGKADIPTVDSFVCQHPTAWSGLGVIDILAAALPLMEAQRATLRSWYERHLAYYQVVAASRARLKLINIINDEPYEVHLDNRGPLFKAGQLIFGSLVPWNGLWYWSGEQAVYDHAPEEALSQIRQSLPQTNAAIVYRYDKKRLAGARETVDRLQRLFLDTYGDDLVTYPDGLSMAAAMQKMYRLYNERIPEDIRGQLMEAEGLESTTPKMPYPQAIIEHENGVGVFFTPGEGTEIMLNFNNVLGGFKKRGVDLSEAEAFAMQAFIESEAISPQFVQRLVRDYGAESIAATFLIRQPLGEPDLDYLLRRYKGHFYRNRYPAVTLV